MVFFSLAILLMTDGDPEREHVSFILITVLPDLISYPKIPFPYSVYNDRLIEILPTLIQIGYGTIINKISTLYL